MTLEEIISTRNISEVLHFTTHSGLLGVLHSGAVLSRTRLPEDVQLEHIYKPNSEVRKDLAWFDYVNLSITEINKRFFEASCRWHRESDLWWCILAFDPVILTHSGVVFATTNNMYTGVKRLAGSVGLETLFASTVVQWSGKTVNRAKGTSSNQPTCTQAEALYPEALSVKHLRTIYAIRDDDADEIYAQLELTGHKHVKVAVNPHRF